MAKNNLKYGIYKRVAPHPTCGGTIAQIIYISSKETFVRYLDSDYKQDTLWYNNQANWDVFIKRIDELVCCFCNEARPAQEFVTSGKIDFIAYRYGMDCWSCGKKKFDKV